jgi:hypothetical protein
MWLTYSDREKEHRCVKMDTSKIWYADPVSTFGPKNYTCSSLLKWLCSNNSTLYFDSVYMVAGGDSHRDVRYMLPLVIDCSSNIRYKRGIHFKGRKIWQNNTADTQSHHVSPYGRQSHMNVMLDYINMPERPSAYDVTDPLVQQAVRINTWTSTRRSVCRWSNGWQQFYTMPSTTIPNDQKGSGSFYAAMSWRPVKTQHGFWYLFQINNCPKNCIFLW